MPNDTPGYAVPADGNTFIPDWQPPDDPANSVPWPEGWPRMDTEPEIQSAGLRRRLYWYWWLKQMLIEHAKEFLAKYGPEPDEPEADTPAIVESKCVSN